MEISIHDNRLLSYCVSGEAREIRLHTIYDDREPNEYTDVVFSGVVAYFFEQDNFGTIIFDVHETDVAKLYAAQKMQFEIGRKYCWPGAWNTSEQATLSHLVSYGTKAFELCSSIGMNGWVLAQSMSIIAINGPKVPTTIEAIQ